MHQEARVRLDPPVFLWGQRYFLFPPLYLETNVSYAVAMTTQSEISIRPGRPREFDTDAVLDKAIKRFSEYGYHGTSIADLNACLGLTSGSIYKAWGDKRGLFLAALDRYMALRAEAIAAQLLDRHSGRDKIQALLTQYAQLSGEIPGRTGCLVVEAAVELSQADMDVADRIAAQQNRREAQLRRLIEEGQLDGSVNAQIDAAPLAKLLLALQQGMRVLGKTGSSSEAMSGMVFELMRLLE
ncbi:transcriptional regulator, TetR family [Pseudomonas sp. NFACC32-1]|uniref:TetR/AcrR family transcriptional regulator n=2 Tax=Pseudomonas TaxID=286 RepID=UPI0008771B43|nr:MULTISPECIES: TetR/AcrR family transcriptional regulator [Pseudomonas]MDB6442494.1 TetR/AcrR family transcriptional regulator [Pseudomonas sp. 21TX0197]SCX65459.1 transcriptional regulator, TetR family [Pseudomonas sp. NFACC32-1]SFX99658.1 transcriptional regulator, TetR family [Pseudomonas sp. NFACC36]